MDTRSKERASTKASNQHAVPGVKLAFGYDAQSRRISKVVSNWTGSAWSFGTATKFVYDNWNLLAELDSTNAVVRSYIWGLDLSGTEQGAGGVGGLLFIGNRSSVIGHYAAAYDGNGNVMALVDMAGAGLAAAYEYGPFGELIRSTGAMSESNPFRFSTKYQDDETGLLYYGYRYYQPNTGRWLSRDPIGENGGENQYEFAMNDSVSYIDPDGAKSKKLPPIYTPPTPGKLAMCLARCGVMDIIGGAYEDKFEANRLCGKIKNHCETEGALPKPEDMAGAVDLKPGGNAWGRAAKCFVDCLGLTCQFDVEGEGLYAGGGRIFCNKATQRVDYSIPITLRLKLVPGGHVLTEQKKTNNGSCGTVAYSRCCCGE